MSVEGEPSLTRSCGFPVDNDPSLGSAERDRLFTELSARSQRVFRYAHYDCKVLGPPSQEGSQMAPRARRFSAKFTLIGLGIAGAFLLVGGRADSAIKTPDVPDVPAVSNVRDALDDVRSRVGLPSLKAPSVGKDSVADLGIPDRARAPRFAIGGADSMRYGCGPVNDALTGLVDDEKLSDAQAQAIHEGLRSRLPGRFRHGDEAAEAEALDETLSDLVGKGTIEKADADAVRDAVTSARTSGTSS